jgi:hypothetical protein
LLAGSETRDRLLSSAARSFDRALRQVCYETQPNFEEIATFYGSVQLNEEALDGIRRDLVNRRHHYLAARQQLTSEVACDASAFSSVAHLAMAQESQPSEDFYYYVMFWCYLIFCMSDLHQAMNARGLLSEESGVENEKPAGIADANFRKVACRQSALSGR